MNYFKNCSYSEMDKFASYKMAFASKGVQAGKLKQYLVGCCMLLSSLLLFATHVSAQPFAYILTQENNIAVIDTETNDYNTDIIELPEGVTDLWAVAVHPDGTKIYVSTRSTLFNPGAPGTLNDKSIFVINTDTKLVEDVIQNDKIVTELALSPDGKHLYGLTYDSDLQKSRQLLVIDTDTYEIGRVELACHEFGCIDWYDAANLAVSPDGQWVYVLENSGVSELNVIDTKSLEVIKRTNLTLGSSSVSTLAVSPSDGKVYVPLSLPSQNAVIAVIDPEALDDQPTYIEGVMEYGGPLVVSKDGSLLYVVQNLGYERVFVINTNSGRLEDTIPAGLQAGSISITPDGKQIYVMNYSSVSVIDTSTNLATIPIPIYELPINNSKVKFIMTSQPTMPSPPTY